jgi:hypothetical protein
MSAVWLLPPLQSKPTAIEAHYDQRGLAGPAPTFQELTECLQVLDDIFKKYHVLLRGTSLHSVLPTIIPEWQAIFRFPWVA